MASKKPTAPVVHALASDTRADTASYAVTGRIWRNGQLLRPANPAAGRDADTVELTEREAHGLHGFVEPIATPTNTSA